MNIRNKPRSNFLGIVNASDVLSHLVMWNIVYRAAYINMLTSIRRWRIPGNVKYTAKYTHADTFIWI